MKGTDDTLPFGTEHDILAEGYRTILYSINATEVAEEFKRVLIGGPACLQPYSASRLNISALSFGALSSNAILALNKGAKLGDFAHNTGEGGLSDYHLKPGGDLIWQIGTGYFGCRNVDGSEGGTGAAPVEFSNRLGTPCLEATYYIHQVLRGAGLRNSIKLISAGQTASGFDILEKISVGADTVNSARAMMLALGCVQAKACNTNKCPSGVATQNPFRARAVDVEEKAVRVRNYHHGTVHAFMELCGAMGYDNPAKLKPSDLFSRCDLGLQHYDQIYQPLLERQLLSESIPAYYADDWNRATSAAF